MHSEKLKFIYLHVPKTGGNSIQRILLPFSDDSTVLKRHQNGADRFGVSGPVTPRKHARLREYAARLDVEAYRCAISVRHPFDRAISLYFSPNRWMRDTEKGWKPVEPVWRAEDFSALLDRVPSMSSFLEYPAGRKEPEFVIRYENIQADFSKMLFALSLPPAVLPHLNKSAANGDLLKSIKADAGLRRMVEDRYRDDMEAFSY